MPSSHAPAEADGASSDEEQRPSKRSKSNTALSSTSDHQKGAPPKHVAQDVTALALNGGSSSSLVATPLCSAFGYFTPAKPPVAHSSWIGSSSDLRPPRDTPPSSARARQWKMSQIQRHADSMAFFSRDRLETRDEIPESFDDGLIGCCDVALRIDSFESTGSLLWMQTQCLECGERPATDSWMARGCTFSHTVFDGSGRQRGAERLLNSYGPLDEDEDYDDLEEDDNPEQYTLAHSQLAVTPFLHRSYNGNKLYEVIQYDFNPDSSSLPRGLEKLPFGEPCEINDAFIESRGGWTVYDRPIWKSTFSTPVWPLFPGDPCASILNWWPKKKTEKEKNPGRGDEMTLTVTVEEEVGRGWILREMHLAPLEICFPELPFPDEHFFSHIAINEGTGFCWFGHSDGTIEFFDAPSWMELNFISCPFYDREDYDDDDDEHGVFCQCCMDPIQPKKIVNADAGLGAVTNLVAVGHTEAVAAFTGGAVVLLQKGVGEGKKNFVKRQRKFIGHISKGTGNVEMVVDSRSRLMAIRGSDGQIRIWHLDDPYPLNSAWHRPRLAAPLQLLPETASRPVKRLEKPQATTRGAKDDATWDLLATQNVNEAAFAAIKAAPLADLHVKPFCSMTWAPTSWLADRDGQWELSRGFDEKRMAKVVPAGLLPSLVFCSDRPKGTAFLYFEPARRVSVDDSEVEEGQEVARAAAIVYEGAEALD